MENISPFSEAENRSTALAHHNLIISLSFRQRIEWHMATPLPATTEHASLCHRLASPPSSSSEVRLDPRSHPAHMLLRGPPPQRCRTFAIDIVASIGQYGHLNRTFLLPRPSLLSDPYASTWPQGSNIGGFPGVAGSLETGHEKIEWCIPLRPGNCENAG